jgi:prevent-host-death family protein
MNRIRIAALKDRLSETLRRVEAGESIVVTDRERPIATLSPIGSEDAALVLPRERPFSAVRRRRFGPTRRRVDSLALLRAERGER